MNADFFEDPQPGSPLAPAPADAQDANVHLQALPPSPASVTDDSPLTSEAMPPAPTPQDFDSQKESQESQLPTWSDYAAQQSVNAQLAERVAELTKATHLLWREERALRRRGHQQILKLKQQCHMQHMQHKHVKHVHVNVVADEERHIQKNLRQTPIMPVSLTHAKTRHHRNNRLNSGLNTDAASTSAGAAVSADQGPLIGTNIGSMAAMYRVEDGSTTNHDEPHEAGKKRELEDELAASRARLGRNEEARLHLEDQIRELEEKYQKGMRDAAQRQQDLIAAQKRVRAKELELESVKKNG